MVQQKAKAELRGLGRKQLIDAQLHKAHELDLVMQVRARQSLRSDMDPSLFIVIY